MVRFFFGGRRHSVGALAIRFLGNVVVLAYGDHTLSLNPLLRIAYDTVIYRREFAHH